MTNPWYAAPWHRESYDRFVEKGLPELISSRLPLAAYSVKAEETGGYRISLTLGGDHGIGHLEAVLPGPDPEGIFGFDGKRLVVVPIASSEDLDAAEVRCVGEQMYDFISARLGEAPPDLTWDDSQAAGWLPFDTWMREFFEAAFPHEGDARDRRIHVLDDTNWCARAEHVRRIAVPGREKAITPSQIGRVDPFTTPEGPNMGIILSVARGATIREGRIAILDDSLAAGLSVTSSFVPLIEHDDGCRILMGANMMRQWVVPPESEPALVRTGLEPPVSRLWCGWNLLTAYVSWGADSYEDAIVISESCARRLFTDAPVEPGDKLSNRHGAKGVVSKILPDSEMPHLADGTPVELVYDFLGLQTRMNFGQVREAVLGRIARAERHPVLAPPFGGPKGAEIRERLKKAGLPETGMEVLRAGKDGPALERPSTVGWVYWGMTHHMVRGKLHATACTGREKAQKQTQEYHVLASIGAYETIIEHFNTRSFDRKDVSSLADRIARGPVEQAGPPTPSFLDLQRRLAAGGIKAGFDGEKVGFTLAPPEGPVLKLADPVPHPWLNGVMLAEVGALPDLGTYRALAAANAQVERVLASHAPGSLTTRSRESLKRCVREFFDELVRAEDNVHLKAKTAFSGRSVIAPGGSLKADQIGIPDGIAWPLFAPLVTRELGDESEAAGRTVKAAAKLDGIMARSWVILERAPAIMPTSLVAFHPVRIPEKVIRIHPLVCMAINGDFDGDQVAVFLPITEAGQREAGELLSVAGHIRRDPALIRWFRPTQDMVWGLADLSRKPEGMQKIAEAAGAEIGMPEGIVTRDSILAAAQSVMTLKGIEAAIEAMERLMRLGFAEAKKSGASLSPFVGSSLPRLAPPSADDPAEWMIHGDELMELIGSLKDYASADIGPQLLAVRSGARGNLRQLQRITGSCVVEGFNEKLVPVKNGYRDGLTGLEMIECVRGWRQGLFECIMGFDLMRVAYGVNKPEPPRGFNVFARAMRSANPGIVFARAAAANETDPLTDPDSRLFVGLKPQ